MRRKKHSNEMKARVARMALREDRTMAEIAATFGVHPNLVSRWKQQVEEAMAEIFARGGAGGPRRNSEDESEKARLYEKIGRLEVEIDWLKKKSGPDR